MRVILIITIISTLLWCACGSNFVVGNVANRVILAHDEHVQYNAIPFIKRVKYFFYTDPQNKVIEGIQALDNLHSKSSINITAGGVGSSFVNLRLKSERGGALDYDIGIYVRLIFYK